MIAGRFLSESFNPKPEAMADSGMDRPLAIASGFGLNELFSIGSGISFNQHKGMKCQTLQATTARGGKER